MEHEDHPFDFLEAEDSRNYFAKLDIALKSGRHIQNYEPDVLLFGYCETYSVELQRYYDTLFQLELGKGNLDLDDYYYLQLKEDQRSRIPSGLQQEMEGSDIILGLVLVNYYHVKYLESEKVLSFEAFLDLLFEQERKDDFLRLFTKTEGDNYNSRSDEKLRSKLKATLGRFEKLGWIRTVEKGEADSFMLMPSIDRLGRMYGREIATHFQDASTKKSETDQS
jgi:chromosome condensin MukBEF MukE localization factor